MTRRTFINGDVWDADAANAAGYPQLNGIDEYGNGPKIPNNWLSDDPDQIKQDFYGWFERVRLTLPSSGRAVSYSAYSATKGDGAVSSFSAGMLTLPNNTPTGYVYLNDNGVMTSGNSLPDVGVHIANFTTASGEITFFQDVRYQANEQIRPIRLRNDAYPRVGDIIPSARTDSGADYMFCNGRSLSTSQYPELFAAIGTTYNLGNEPLGTFRIPDLRERVIVGVSGSADFKRGYGLGEMFGVDEVALSRAQMPEHKHNIQDSQHSHNVSVAPHSHNVSDPGHTHDVTNKPHDHRIPSFIEGLVDRVGNDGIGTNAIIRANGADVRTNREEVVSSVQPSTTGIALSNARVQVELSANRSNIDMDTSGSSQPHENRQPSIALNYFIRWR